MKRSLAIAVGIPHETAVVDADSECPICNDPLADRSFTTNPCGHSFHDSCLLRAGALRARQPSLLLCGVCRAPIQALQIEASSGAAGNITAAPVVRQAAAASRVWLPIAPRGHVAAAALARAAPPPPAPPLPPSFAPEDADLPPPPASAGTADVTLSHAVDAAGGAVTLAVGALRGPAPRLRLVCLLDVSASMRGAKLRTLAATLAALLQELDGGDRLALVAFDGAARLPLPLRVTHTAGKAAAGAVLAGLACGSGTNIRAALAAAAGVLSASAAAGGVSAVLLLSDGQDLCPKETEARAAALGAAGVPVFAVGIGADHDHALLSRLAAASGGTFAYAEAAEGIPGAVGVVIGALKSCVGIDATLTLVVPGAGAGTGAAAGASAGGGAAAAAQAAPQQRPPVPIPGAPRLLCAGTVRSWTCPATCDVLLTYARVGGGASSPSPAAAAATPPAAAAAAQERLWHAVRPAVAGAGGGALALAAVRAREVVGSALLAAAAAVDDGAAAAILHSAAARLAASAAATSAVGTALAGELRTSEAALWRRDRARLTSAGARVSEQSLQLPGGASSGLSVSMVAAARRMRVTTLSLREQEPEAEPEEREGAAARVAVSEEAAAPAAGAAAAAAAAAAAEADRGTHGGGHVSGLEVYTLREPDEAEL